MPQTWTQEELEDGEEYARRLCDVLERGLKDELARVKKRAPERLFTHIKAFNDHCRATIGLIDSMMATPEIVAAYLVELVLDGKSKRYVRDARDSIEYAFDRLGAPPPTAHSLVRAVMLRNNARLRSVEDVQAYRGKAATETQH